MCTWQLMLSALLVDCCCLQLGMAALARTVPPPGLDCTPFEPLRVPCQTFPVPSPVIHKLNSPTYSSTRGGPCDQISLQR